MKRKLIAAIGVAGMLFSVAACGGDDGDGKSTGADGYEGQTLTVWVMDGSSPDEWQKDLAAEFETKTKAKVKFEVQQWNGIQQKLTTSLSEENPPDVFEVGNTQTPAYARDRRPRRPHRAEVVHRRGLDRVPQRVVRLRGQAVRGAVVLRQPRGPLQQEGLGRRGPQGHAQDP
ncbi:hypothetical protein SHIRM173S_01810 [Streptomyces hirsutus]